MSDVRTLPATAGLDRFAMMLWLMALSIGVVAVASASMELALSRHGDAFHHTWRHLVYLGISVLAFLVTLAVPTRLWLKLDMVGYGAALVLLFAVLLLGREVNGSIRWIAIGPFSLQPSEAAKFLLVVYMAGYCVRHAEAIRSRFAGVMRPVIWLALPCVLLLAEPDLGSAVVIVGATGLLLFLVGARLLHLTVLAASATGAMVLLVWLQPYRVQRLEAFLNPWREDVAFGSGYQLTQALIAFGRGEWFGVGLGEGLQKLFYLPEAHTDFIYAVIAEETGVFGAVVVVALLTALVMRGIGHGQVAWQRGDKGAAALAWGAALMLGVQTMISLGVNTGLLPTKGLTLPLISYGGNSLIVSSALVALMVRVHWENQAANGGAAGTGRRQRRMAA